jgi:hypothetical protein
MNQTTFEIENYALVVERIADAVRKARECFPSRNSRRQNWHDFYSKRIFKCNTYAELLEKAKHEKLLPRKVAVYTHGIYSTASKGNGTYTFQELLNQLGPYCKDEYGQIEMLEAIEAHAQKCLIKEIGITPRRAAYKLGFNSIGVFFLYIYHAHGGDLVTPKRNWAGRMQIQIKEHKLIKLIPF